MVTSLVNGFLGLILTLCIGIMALDLPPPQLILAVLTSNGAALAALLLTLKIERTPSIAKYKINGFFGSWSILTFLYFGTLLSLCPPLREIRCLTYLGFPLILSTGFSITLFGPIQDYLVSKSQRKTRSMQRSKQEFILPIS